MSERKLAATVHHKGRRYLAGTTAKDLGDDVAEQLGDHVWDDYEAPQQAAGSYTASPQGSRSGLPGPHDSSEDVATALRTEGGRNTPTAPGADPRTETAATTAAAPEETGDNPASTAPKRATGGTRR